MVKNYGEKSTGSVAFINATEPVDSHKKLISRNTSK